MCFGGKGLGDVINPVGTILGDKSPSAVIAKATGIKALDPRQILNSKKNNTKDPAPAPLAAVKTKKPEVKTALGAVSGKTALGG